MRTVKGRRKDDSTDKVLQTSKVVLELFSIFHLL